MCWFVVVVGAITVADAKSVRVGMVGAGLVVLGFAGYLLRLWWGV